MAIQRSVLVTKAQELMKNEGLDGASAAKKARELMSTTTPAPVTNPTPTPVSPTVNVSDQMAGKSVAERQAIRSGQIVTPPVTPTPVTEIKQAPVDQTTGLSKPLEATPVITEAVKAPEPVKTEPASAVTPKTEAPIDYTQAKGREQDIINNLNTFKAQNMTPEQIMKASDYQNAAPEKRALIEPYLKQQVPTASAMYNAIVSKADIPDDQKTTLPFKIAQNRYTKASSFSTMTPAQLANEMNNSRFIQGSQDYEDVKAMNPKLVQDTENLRIVNGSKQNVFTYINNPDGTSTKVNNLEKTFAEDFMDNFGEVIKNMYAVQTPEQIRAIIYTDDVKQAQDKATEIELSMNELEKQIDQVDADVDKELAGSGATGSRIALEKAIRKDKLEKEYNSQLKNYTTYANKANNLITQNTTLYTTQQQQKQAQNAAMLPFLQDQYNTEQEKIKAEQALNDPATQIKATMDEFAKLGIVAQGDLTSKLAEFKTSGKTLPEYITGLRAQFMSKPEYQQMLAKNKGAGVSYQTIGNKVYKIGADGSITETNISTGADESKWGVIGKNADGSDKYGFINTATSTVTPYIAPTGEATGDLRYLANQYPGQAWAKNNNPAGITWNSNFDKGTGTAKLFADAGIKFEKGTARPANEGGNYVTFATIEDGLKAQQILMTQTYGNSTVGQMLSSWVGTSEGPNYAKQVAGMAGITDLNQKVSALSPEQVSKLQMAKIQKESPGLAKLLTQPTTTPTNSNQYTDQNINDLAYLVELQEKNPTQAAKDMKELGYSARDLANYKAGNVPLTEKQKTTSTDIISSITDLVTNYDWNDAVGKFDYTRLIGTQDAEDTNVAINNLVAKLTLPNLGVLKGPMSDKDIQFIKEASSKLSTTQSNSSFERNLIDAYNLAARRAGKPEIKKLSDISAGTQSSTVGGELDYSKYE